MNVDGKHYRTIWVKPEDETVIQIIDQRALPHKFVIEDITNIREMATAIREMHLRGAGLIGAAAGYGMYLAALESYKLLPSAAATEGYLIGTANLLKKTRPTAVNLEHAVNKQLKAFNTLDLKMPSEVKKVASYLLETAELIADEDAEYCRRIGEHGLGIIERISREKRGSPVNILTHCNAGWLAFADYGTATAPIYAAFEKGIPVHVWVDVTAPWNQGAKLTAWELGQQGVPHTLIADNTGGHLMQHGLVDMVIVGSDRTTRTGDAANKIGTYLKALAAKDNNVPFYVALPSSTFDWNMGDGIKEIPIEERGSEEVKYVRGLCEGEIRKVLIAPENSPALNYGFDVTPARLITGLITERGISKADEKSILELFPEHK